MSPSCPQPFTRVGWAGGGHHRVRHFVGFVLFNLQGQATSVRKENDASSQASSVLFFSFLFLGFFFFLHDVIIACIWIHFRKKKMVPFQCEKAKTQHFENAEITRSLCLCSPIPSDCCPAIFPATAVQQTPPEPCLGQCLWGSRLETPHHGHSRGHEGTGRAPLTCILKVFGVQMLRSVGRD